MTSYSPGQVGPYTIAREIGRGGMGVVYLARDTKLDRDVAIKCLPDELADDTDRLVRFEREAKLLASLNHPNIATIHGLEEVDGKRYLILEYVEGKTLEEKLSAGAIPVDEALPIAKQIAEAIEAAHEKGVIHRDLKPANIKFTTSGGGGDQVKVLDFGLAKALVDETSTASELAHSPTIVAGGSPTLAGVVLGTAGYLSPEQARGRSVDKRTDIFSFGCVLYEMLTGKRLFTGETVSDILASTLKVEPVWADLPADTPPTIHLLLRRCLAKDHKRRLQDIGSARVEIEEAIADPSGSSLSLAMSALQAVDARAGISPKRMAGVVGLAVLLTVAVMLLTRKTPEPAIEHYSIIIPHRTSDLSSFLPTLAISSDGSTIAFSGRNEDNVNQIFLRRRNSTEVIPVSGTLGGEQPRFSPDGKWLTYGTGSSFCKTSVLGGPTTIISEEPRTPGHTWLSDDQIVYCTYDDGKSWIVPAAGGTPKQFVPDEIQPEHAALSWPETLPGGNAVLFDMHYQGSNEQRSIVVYDLTTGRLKTLVEQGAYPRYAKSGHLLYVHETTLMAAPFDASALELTGPSTPFRSDFKMTSFAGASDYAIADDGTLISLANKDVPGLMPTRIDLKGVSQPATSHKQPFNWIRLAPDGMKAAVIISEGSVFETSLWLLDFERDLLTLLTPEQGNQYYPIFSPDSQWLYYTQWISGRVEYEGLYRRRVDGSGGPEKLKINTTRSLDENRIFLDNFSPDGRILYLSISTDSFKGDLNEPMDVYTLTLDDQLKLEPLIATPANEYFAAPSPDGRWLAYTSDESGISQVYIRPIDGRGARVQVSRDGGMNPLWSPDGSTMYFRTESRMIRAALISVNDEPDSASVLRVGDISDLFIHTSPHRNFDLYPDGEHFLMLISGINEEAVERTEIRITLNFSEELKRLAPTGKN